MFERIVNAVEPFALTMVIIAGLILSGGIKVANSHTVGYATIFVGVCLVIVYIGKELRNPNKKAK